jgi:CBS domain containing-hemolysin-like protein
MSALRLMLVTANYSGTGDNMDWLVLAETPDTAVDKYLAEQEMARDDFDHIKVWNITALQTEPRTGDVIDWNQKHCTVIK